MTLNKRGIRASFGAIMLFQVCALFASEFLHLRLSQAGLSDPNAEWVSKLAGFLVLAVLMLPILRNTWPALRALFRIPKNSNAILLAASAIGFLIYLINTVALIWIATLPWLTLPIEHPSPIFVSAFTCTDPSVLLIAIPILAILTPIAEETINRGLILFTLLPRGRILAVVGSAVFFSVLHKPATDPAVFIFGIYAALQVLYWRNLWAPIVTHGVFNAFVQIDIQCIEKSWIPGRVSDWFVTSAILSATVILVCILGIIWLTLKFKIGATTIGAAPITYRKSRLER